MNPIDLLTVRVAEMAANGAGNLRIRLEAKQPLPAFTPDTHLDVLIPGLGKRQYSLCFPPVERRYYEICVQESADTTCGGRWLHRQLSKGDTWAISVPRNHFLLPVARRHLLFAGGIGITPLLLMAEQLAARQCDFELHYYLNRAAQTAFMARLQAPGLRERVVLHYSEQGDSLRRRSPPCLAHPAADSVVIACGPQGFLDHLRQQMAETRWQADQLQYELFQRDALPDTAAQEGFEVQIASSDQRF